MSFGVKGLIKTYGKSYFRKWFSFFFRHCCSGVWCTWTSSEIRSRHQGNACWLDLTEWGEIDKQNKTAYQQVSWKRVLHFSRFKYGRTDSNKWRNPKTILYRSAPNSASHTVGVHGCRLLLTERQSACHVQRITVQHIYCTYTVQTVQSTAELYLQHSHTTCRYTFRYTTPHNLSSWCLLQSSPARCFTLHLYQSVYIQSCR
jgi:hypothetical protein